MDSTIQNNYSIMNTGVKTKIRGKYVFEGFCGNARGDVV